jgi:hypothetical protein
VSPEERQKKGATLLELIANLRAVEARKAELMRELEHYATLLSLGVDPDNVKSFSPAYGGRSNKDTRVTFKDGSRARILRGFVPYRKPKAA